MVLRSVAKVFFAQDYRKRTALNDDGLKNAMIELGKEK